MIKGAIFDLDGTLLDSMWIWDSFGEDYLRTLGKEPKENLTETFRPFTLEQAAEYYRKHYGVTLSVKEIVDDVNEMVESYYRTRVELKSGVGEFLKDLQASDVKMCVATVTDRHIAHAVLERLGIRKYFVEIFTCAEVGHSKEEPHIFRVALDCLGTPKKETLVFEDSFHALMTAKNDGFVTVAVYDEYEPRQEALRNAADHYMTDFHHVHFEDS